jgi:hypothetical protein
VGPQARGAVPALTELLRTRVRGKGKKKGAEDIRPDVAEALGQIATDKDKRAIEALKAVVEGRERNRALKKAAATALRGDGAAQGPGAEGREVSEVP